MTDALKAAVREALDNTVHFETGNVDLLAYDLTIALASRGVVVAGEPIDFPYHRTFNAIADAVKIEAGAISISVDKFQKSFNHSATVAGRGPDNCSQAAAGESPAPKPVRKVVQIAIASSIGGIAHTCLDDAGTHYWWEAKKESWIPFPPIPQPGEEQ
jgi:hypothetical protein